MVAKGGSGGRGNKKFAGATHQSPTFAERGLDGAESWLDLQLKLLADVGLVGLPNAGKSSMLGRMTRAAPKVANYPFTTLEPILGTLDGDERQLVLADIPGLIEGASDGAGLGHEFLAHVERTRLLVHVLDLAPLDGSDPEENFATIERELAEYDERLATLPRILALSKADLVSPEQAEAAAQAWRERFAAELPEREEVGGAGRGDAGTDHLLGDRTGSRGAEGRAVSARSGARRRTAAAGPRRGRDPGRAPGLPAGRGSPRQGVRGRAG